MRILLIEDSELVQKALVRLIKDMHPLTVTDVVDDALEAVDRLDKFAYDYVVSDFDLRIGTGGDVLRYVRAHFAHYIERRRFILMTGDLRPAVINLNHPLTFEKPIRPQKLRELLTEGLK
jgi:DNA-binding NarL/FixJ family response regulator